jgi:hypothetical protein
VADALAEAKLSFVGSCKVLNTVDGVNLTPAGIEPLATIANPRFRQVVREFYTGASFRHDVFRARGASALASGENCSP